MNHLFSFTPIPLGKMCLYFFLKVKQPSYGCTPTSPMPLIRYHPLSFILSPSTIFFPSAKKYAQFSMFLRHLFLTSSSSCFSLFLDGIGSFTCLVFYWNCYGPTGTLISKESGLCSDLIQTDFSATFNTAHYIAPTWNLSFLLLLGHYHLLTILSSFISFIGFPSFIHF